jgi:hypothetical protein
VDGEFFESQINNGIGAKIFAVSACFGVWNCIHNNIHSLKIIELGVQVE